MIAVDGGTEMLKTLFKGIVINKQVYLDTSTGSTGGSTLNTNEDRAIFPIIKTHVEAASNGHKPKIAFFGIGYDYVYRNHLKYHNRNRRCHHDILKNLFFYNIMNILV